MKPWLRPPIMDVDGCPLTGARLETMLFSLHNIIEYDAPSRGHDLKQESTRYCNYNNGMPPHGGTT